MKSNRRYVQPLLAITAAGVLLGSGPAWAQSPPPGAPPHAAPSGPEAAKPRREAPKPESRADVLQRLYGELAKAPDAAAAEPIVRNIEQLWVQAESPTATLLMNRALVAANEKNYDLSLKFLDTVTELYPAWTEGFNRRAYLYVIQLDYNRALGDLRRVLALDPGNFRALEGLVQVLRTMGQDKAALDVVKTLLKAHPHSPGAQETLKELEEAVTGRGI
ncbi:MAG: tetratricopeptide repeat protein [Hyphomicrobium sp.]